MSKTYNNTILTEREIAILPVIGKTVNNWRQREIVLLAHPTNTDRLISVGTTFDGKMIVIADEERKDYKTALDYISRGKVYTSS